MQANLNQKIQKKIEIVIIHGGELVHIVTGFLGGQNHEWKIDRKQFETFIDDRGKRSWSLESFDGSKFNNIKGQMSWDEYYEDIRAFEEDVAEFISYQHTESLILTNKL